MTEWNNDSELFALMKDVLYTPVVGDILDALGCYHQFLPQPIQPIRQADKVAGRAMPALVQDVYGPQKKPFGQLADSLDQLQPGEVYVTGGCAARSAPS